MGRLCKVLSIAIDNAHRAPRKLVMYAKAKVVLTKYTHCFGHKLGKMFHFKASVQLLKSASLKMNALKITILCYWSRHFDSRRSVCIQSWSLSYFI